MLKECEWLMRMRDKIKEISMIAADLDGTLLERDKTVLPALKEALKRIADEGIKIATASGRQAMGIYEDDQVSILERNGLGVKSGFPHFLIADEQEIYFLTDSGYKPYISHNRKVREAWLSVWPEARKIACKEFERLSMQGVKVRLEFESEEEEKERGKIILLFENIEDARAEEAHLKEILSGNRFLTCNRHRNAVQILHVYAGKGNTLKKLSEYLNIPPSKILCIGDSVHDVSMLDGRFGFLAATTSNAEEEVKEAVRSCGGYVASKPQGEGVLEILSKYGLID